MFTAVATLQGAVRVGYDARQQSVSALSLGPGGWVQQLNFVLFGALIVSTVPALRTILRGGVGARSYPALTMLSGLALITVGFIPQDPAPGYDPEQLGLTLPTAAGLTHLALAGVAMLGSVGGLFVMAARFARDPHWKAWVRPTQLVAAFAIVCVSVIYLRRHNPTLERPFRVPAYPLVPILGIVFCVVFMMGPILLDILSKAIGHDLLGLTERIDVRRVDGVYPRLDGQVDHATSELHVDVPRAVKAVLATEGEGAEDVLRDFEAGAAEG